MPIIEFKKYQILLGQRTLANLADEIIFIVLVIFSMLRIDLRRMPSSLSLPEELRTCVNDWRATGVNIFFAFSETIKKSQFLRSHINRALLRRFLSKLAQCHFLFVLTLQCYSRRQLAGSSQSEWAVNLQKGKKWRESLLLVIFDFYSSIREYLD